MKEVAPQHEVNTLGTLHHLLDAGAQHDCEYADGLSNHLPMALVALHTLGANDARMKSFAKRYGQRLPKAPAPVAWESGAPWAARLGQRQAWAAYRDLFGQWLMHERPEEVLPQVLPQLMRGVGAAAFHGLIRTACGVAAKHLGEVVDGLAYWACTHQPLWDLPTAPTSHETDPEAVLGRLLARQSQAPLISLRMAEVAQDTRLRRAVAQLVVDERTLPTLARLAAYAYAGSANFTVLHLLTSAHAMRQLLPFMEEPVPAIRWYWQAFATGVVAARIKPLGEPTLHHWDRIIESAIASDDEHDIKLVYSCREQAKVDGSVAWQYAASRMVKTAAKPER